MRMIHDAGLIFTWYTCVCVRENTFLDALSEDALFLDVLSVHVLMHILSAYMCLKVHEQIDSHRESETQR